MIPHAPAGRLPMELNKVGKYDITAKIGQGAMGEVYKAHDPILNRFVAIKTMSAAIGSDDELRKRFLREAQSAARLNHPNIITLFDFGEDHGKIYMAMELLEGSDLKDLIASHGIASLEDKLGFMEQICDGLGFAHMQEVVHRDLKPANIHVQPNGQIKIMDFGLARLGTSEMTRTGMVMGTPHYMSPEQVKGKRADFRSDIFSLGAVFYELLTGHKPFDAESLHAVLFQVMEHQPEDVRHWSPEVPNILVQVVDRALNKDPEQRYQHAGDMREALRLVRQVLSGEVEEDHALATLIGSFPAQDGTIVTDGTPPVEATVLEPSSSRSGAGRVSGSSALKPATSSKFGKTAVPSKTSPPRLGSNPPAMRSGARRPLSRPPVPRPMAEAPSRMPIYVGGAVAVVAIAIAAAVYLRPPTKTDGGDTGPSKVDSAQTRMLLDQMVEVARKNLELKDYKGAVEQAEKVIKLDPANADAAQVRDKASNTLAALDAAADEARAAVQAGDTEKAARAISRVLEIDPNHPVAAELSSQLNSRFKDQAEQARREMRSAATAAERAKASLSDSASALALGRQAEELFLKNQFMASTQKFLESRDGYERARAAAVQRQADINRPPATLPATMPPATTPATLPPTTVPPPTVPPTTQAPATMPPATLPPATQPASEEPAVRRVIAEYGRALQSKDLALFRAIKPNLSGAEEDKLRASFANIKDWRVNISVSSVLIDGSQATVHASRNDTVNGKPVSLHQTFTLTKGANGWTIREIGQ
jgi:serine/threonine protein kinase/tetratricopeptide (TPR) repeat protein